MRWMMVLGLGAGCDGQAPEPTEVCDNSRDDDGDSLVDCADSDCLGQCPESCVDSLDNDGDGWVDCADPDCDGLCLEDCFDGRDNDGDGLFDCGDADCLGSCPEDCSDGQDNDGDGIIDCLDPDCNHPVCPERCDDSQDNDGDGDVDCADADCDGWCPEDCSDGRDNDGDGSIDCTDRDCDGACPEDCFDGWDNDADGLLDCADTDCAAICDQDGDGFADIAGGGTDCDDGDSAIHPDALEACNGADDDCDGLVDDADFDFDPATLMPLYRDGDGDGYGREPHNDLGCAPEPGMVLLGGDCNDDNVQVNPDEPEICDTVDNDCDSLVDDADPSVDSAQMALWYFDADDDGYGDATDSVRACLRPEGYVANGDDCQVADPDVAQPGEWWIDGDDDGYGAGVPVVACISPPDHVASGDDCDDSNPAVNPETPWYLDADLDGYGDPLAVTSSCLQPWAHVANDLDCDDLDYWVNPDTEWPYDGDGDGYGDLVLTVVGCAPPDRAAEATDCDDDDPSISPGAPDVCDGIDNDCDLLVDEVASFTWYPDEDGDGSGRPAMTLDDCAQPPGYVLDGTDCDDLDPDLDGLDADGDGWTTCDADCDDTESSTYPGAEDICDDGVDRDCDGNDVCIVTFYGILTEVPEDELYGWEVCHRDNFNYPAPMADLLTACYKENLLLACTGRDGVDITLDVLAHSPREDVLFDMGEQDATHDFNGVGWYFSLNESWGFAEPGDGLNRIPWDLETGVYPERRLSWETNGNGLEFAGRCGNETHINFNRNWERIVFHADF